MNEIINIAIGSVAIGGVVVFLGRKLIDKGFDVAVKTFENKLDLLKIEHQIRYAKLHEERAMLLKEFYKELHELEKALAHMTSLWQGPEWLEDTEGRRPKAVEQLKKSKDMLEDNRIFFSTNFCEKIEIVFDKCLEIINGMDMARKEGKKEDIDARSNRPHKFVDGKTSGDLWTEQEKKVGTEIREMRIELANSFRELIGVKN